MPMQKYKILIQKSTYELSLRISSFPVQAHINYKKKIGYSATSLQWNNQMALAT